MRRLEERLSAGVTVPHGCLHPLLPLRLIKLNVVQLDTLLVTLFFLLWLSHFEKELGFGALALTGDSDPYWTHIIIIVIIVVLP